ncbi:cold-shock protein [Thermoflexus sp.]|jgi:CspA family cold shock protein|uniref:cold-shock protein n=1 Tax=Thermoflexus sp. TaxID=1969742 RepID=UPI003C102AD8
MAGQRVRGTVRWFNRTKGYGFIRPDEGDRDVFVHYTAIVGQGFRNLEEGERVEFTIRETPKGLQAEQVVRLSE